MRPDVVWFGEMPDGLDRIEQALAAADVFVAIGTSGAVYPAAGYVAEARGRGIPDDRDQSRPSDTARAFDEARYGPATETVPAFVAELLAGDRDGASLRGAPYSGNSLVVRRPRLRR